MSSVRAWLNEREPHERPSRSEWDDSIPLECHYCGEAYRAIPENIQCPQCGEANEC